MTTFCLLIFSRNANAEVSRLINRMRGSVDEIVVIDSSDTKTHHSLLMEFGEIANVHRVIPMGITDPFRAYASTKIDSDYVINLDCDEEISDELRRDFRQLDKEAAYVVGWYHVDLKEQAKKLVIYRNKAVRYMGHVFETPTVNGVTVDVSERYRILHFAKMKIDYLKQGNRRDRYFLLESLLRPPTWNVFFRQLSIGSGRGAVKGLLTRFSAAPFWKAAVYATYLSRRLKQRGMKRISKFLLDYGLERLAYFSSMGPSQRALYSEICDEIYSSGGLVSYLALQDPEHMEHLSLSYDWGDREDEMLAPKILIMYRYVRGEPLGSFQEFPYSNEQVAKFWTKGELPEKR